MKAEVARHIVENGGLLAKDSVLSLVDCIESADRKIEQLISDRQQAVVELAAALRERDEYRKLFHANESEKQTLFHQKDMLLTANLNAGNRAREAEAELKRRDEQKPVAVVEHSNYITAAEISGEVPRRKAVRELYADALVFGQELYADAPAAAPVVSFYLDGIEAAANYIDQQREAFDNEHGQCDPDTGSFEFSNIAAEEHSHTLAELAEGVRSLHPNAATAAVLPPEMIPFDDTNPEHVAAAKNYNQALADAKSLGCQPEKVVTLPFALKDISKKWIQAGDMISALDEVGVKWAEGE